MSCVRLLCLHVIIFMLILSTGFSFAQDGEEKITLTTYYPAPFGEYTSLSVGSSYTAPAADGVLIVENSIGIGTADPNETLEVNGGIRIGDTSADTYYTLPDTRALSDGQVLIGDTAGVVSWDNVPTGSGIEFNPDAVSVPDNPITSFRAEWDIAGDLPIYNVITIDSSATPAQGAILNFEKQRLAGFVYATAKDVLIDLHRYDNSNATDTAGSKIGRIFAQGSGSPGASAAVQDMGAFAIVPLVDGKIKATRIRAENNTNVDCDMNVYIVALIY